jgi:hypothetical protein
LSYSRKRSDFSQESSSSDINSSSHNPKKEDSQGKVNLSGTRKGGFEGNNGLRRTRTFTPSDSKGIGFRSSKTGENFFIHNITYFEQVIKEDEGRRKDVDEEDN